MASKLTPHGLPRKKLDAFEVVSKNISLKASIYFLFFDEGNQP
jgi:hypothetical protein